MRLSSFNDQCVRVTLHTGEVFEGACQHNSAEYNEIEYGVCEEGLDVADWLFYKSDIQQVERVEDEDAFLRSFGRIEEETFRDGTDAVEDALFSDEPRNALRMLCCLEQHLPSEADRAPWIALLQKLIRYTNDEDVRQKAEQIVRE